MVIFAAASLSDAISEIGETFGAAHGVEMVYNFSASGALAQQIMAVSRADVFISANDRWMERVETTGRVVPGSRRKILGNALTVIRNPLGQFAMSEPDGFCEPEFSHLSIGDPAFVPAGEYAKAWLEAIPCASGGNAWQAVKTRLSPAPDVRAALGQVEGSADVVGIVYRTDVEAARGRVDVIYNVPATVGTLVVYSAALCEGRGDASLAAAFLEYFSSESVRRIIEEHGFIWLDGN